MACDYLPNNDDIVRARKISTSMEEITFTKKMKKSVSKGSLDKYELKDQLNSCIILQEFQE